MLKKKYNYQHQLFVKYKYKQTFLKLLLIRSFMKNHFLTPKERISYFAQPITIDDITHRFSTYQKLYCLITASPKVHNREYHYSRFFLNKQLDKLTISNTLR